MQAKRTWSDLTILSTRPAVFAAPLIAQLTAKGAQVVNCPTLKTRAITDNAHIKQCIAQLNDYRYQLFISRPAVHAALPEILKQWSMLELTQQRWGAVGPGTQAALQLFAVPHVIVPEQGEGGQALFNTLKPMLSAGERAIIWRGDSGRDQLAQALQAAGVQVTQLACYQREATQADPQPIQALLTQAQLDMIIVTSGLGLENLLTLLAPVTPALKKCTLVVISERLAQLARTLGFQGQIIISPSADEAAIIKSIEDSF